jgi:hypothetical protein
MEDISEALKFVNESKEGQKLFIYCNLTRGIILRRQSKYEEALDVLLKANIKAEALKDDTLCIQH